MPKGDLIVENIQDFSSSTPNLRPFLQKMRWSLQNDYLGWSSLLQRLHEQQKGWKANQGQPNELELRRLVYTTAGEIAKRFCLALSPFSFSLLGLACGLKIGRRPSLFGLFLTLGLTALFLISFFVAKGMEKKWELMLTLYFLPHLLIWGVSFRRFSLLNRGIEI